MLLRPGIRLSMLSSFTECHYSKLRWWIYLCSLEFWEFFLWRMPLWKLRSWCQKLNFYKTALQNLTHFEDAYKGETWILVKEVRKNVYVVKFISAEKRNCSFLHEYATLDLNSKVSGVRTRIPTRHSTEPLSYPSRHVMVNYWARASIRSQHCLQLLATLRDHEKWCKNSPDSTGWTNSFYWHCQLFLMQRIH